MKKIGNNLKHDYKALLLNCLTGAYYWPLSVHDAKSLEDTPLVFISGQKKLTQYQLNRQHITSKEKHEVNVALKLEVTKIVKGEKSADRLNQNIARLADAKILDEQDVNAMREQFGVIVDKCREVLDEEAFIK